MASYYVEYIDAVLIVDRIERVYSACNRYRWIFAYVGDRAVLTFADDCSVRCNTVETERIYCA